MLVASMDKKKPSYLKSNKKKQQRRPKSFQNTNSHQEIQAKKNESYHLKSTPLIGMGLMASKTLDSLHETLSIPVIWQEIIAHASEYLDLSIKIENFFRIPSQWRNQDRERDREREREQREDGFSEGTTVRA